MTDQKDDDRLDDFFSRVILGKGVITCYYRFLREFKEVLDRNNLQFFAHSGTMLGCVRHQGMIPWDDDLDFMMEEVFEDQLLAVIPELEQLGILLKTGSVDGLYQFYCKNKSICNLDVYLQIDLFIGRREVVNGDLVVHYKSLEFKKWFPKRYIRVQDLYPLKHYKFGPLQVLGISNYQPYFNASGFSLDEAIVARHMGFDKFLSEIEELKVEGLYPITRPEILTYRHEVELEDINANPKISGERSSKTTVLTYGTFDLFHVGHIRLLKRLRALGDRLVVGVSTDEFNALKGKSSFFSYEERVEILKACEYVDEVIPENSWDQKKSDIADHDVQIFGMGSDWQQKFDELNELCKVVYLERTEDISTTDIKKALSRVVTGDFEGLESSLSQALMIVRRLGDSIGASRIEGPGGRGLKIEG